LPSLAVPGEPPIPDLTVIPVAGRTEFHEATFELNVFGHWLCIPCGKEEIADGICLQAAPAGSVETTAERRVIGRIGILEV
jgi:hypothetical protein